MVWWWDTIEGQAPVLARWNNPVGFTQGHED